MAPKHSRPLRGIATIALGSAALIATWRRPGLANVDASGGDDGDSKTSVADMLRYPVGLRHSVKVDNGEFSVHGIAQGDSQWAIALGEKGTPVGILQKLDDGPAKFAITYDSDKNSIKPNLADGVDGVRFSATGAEGEDPSNVDWSLRVSGPNGNHFSATTDEGEVVYEGTYTAEKPIADRLSALYAVDMKRRAGDSNLAPSFFRNGLGLKYVSDIGDFKVNVHQPSPDGENNDVEYEAIYSGDLAGPPGSPSYSITASRAPGDATAYQGQVKLKGPEGVTGGLTVDLKDGKTSVKGHTDLSASREVINGIELGTSTRLEASPDGADLQPLNFKAAADLAALVPNFMQDGSELTAKAVYKIGEEKPQLSASATLKPKPVGPLKVSAAGRATEDELTGSVAASARLANFDASYTANKASGKDVHHVGKAVFPAEAAKDANGRSLPQFYGRVTQSAMDHDGKPRVQVGMMYDFNAQGAQFTGQSNLFDNGDQLVDEEGKPWPSAMYNKAKNSAEVLRKRVRGGAGEGTQWLRKRQNFGD